MRDKFTQSSINFITNYYRYEGKEYDRLFYGLQSFYSLATKTIVIIILAIMLGLVKETILMIGTYAIIRCFSFGIHASKSLYCWIVTIPIYILFPYLAKILTISDNLKLLLVVISYISFLLFSPADTPKKPLINSKKRKIDKVFSLLICGCFSILIFNFSNTLSNILLFSLLIQSISINPLTYKLFNVKYNNYRSYKNGLNN